MSEHSFETVDVFTAERFGGNPLAVFPDAAGVPPALMQRIAREFNLSETTFVLPPADPAHTARVRIFTPAQELPFAGHPNVGTALVLAARSGTRPGRMVFEEAAGLVEMALDWSGELPRATLTAPQPLRLGAEMDAASVAECAGLRDGEVLTGLHAPVVAGMGTDFVVAEVMAEALGRAAPDLAAMRRHLGVIADRPRSFALHLHAWTAEGRRTRMFAPLGGILEDPATGSANVALAGLLLACSGEERLAITFEQGVEMGRPSLLHAAAWREGGAIRGSIGGTAVPVMTGRIRV